MMNASHTSRDNNFAMLHMLGALLVIWGHSFNLTGAGNVAVIFGEVAHAIGIKLLFVVSGYLTMMSLQRSRNLRDYYLKRLFRIYPPFAVCVILSTCVLFFFSESNLSEYFSGACKYIASNLIFRIRFQLPGVFANNPLPNNVNGSIWSLPIEFAMQLLLPVILLPLLAVKKWRREVLSWCFFIIYCLLTIVILVVLPRHPEWNLICYGSDWSYLITIGVYFTAGAWYATLTKEQMEKYCRTEIAMVLLLGSVFLSGSYLTWLNYLVLPYIIITAAVKTQAWRPGFWNRADSAYGLYLWSFPVQQSLIAILVVRQGYIISPFTLLILTLLITYPIAWLQKVLLEKKIDLLLRRYLIKKET